MANSVNSFYVWYDEGNEGYAGIEFLGPSYREDGEVVRERVAFYDRIMDHRVVTFKSEEAARNWLAPSGGYDQDNATLVKVSVNYTAEAV